MSTKIDRIVTFRASVPVAITVDLNSRSGASLTDIPEADWPEFLTGFLRDSVRDAFRRVNERPTGEPGDVWLETGPEDVWTYSDTVADVNRETGEIILPPEYELAHVEQAAAAAEFEALLASLLGIDPEQLRGETA